nr:DUF934 domain-containing protein [uncultured Moraxella sp.]
MNIIFANKNGDSYQKSSQIYLITNTEPTADDNAWAGFEPNFISTSQAQKLVKDDNTLVLNVLSDEIDDNANGLLLTADDSFAQVQTVLQTHQSANALPNIVIYQKVFSDGRVFSLIRQLRKHGFDGNIFIAGNFGHDQTAYFSNAGVSAFVVADDDVALAQIVLKTLNDLASAHHGTSANSLPMFRQFSNLF